MMNFWRGSSARPGSTSCCDARRKGDANFFRIRKSRPSARKRVHYPRSARSRRTTEGDLELKGGRPYARVLQTFATAARRAKV